jgi:uncharacterized protein YndB with AHSA1/START domain
MKNREGVLDRALLAKAETSIDAPVARVWRALVTPEDIKRYMFGATVVSDWKVGGPIVWKGEWQGKHYEDKGRILRMEPERLLSYTHFSPLAGLPDEPENYHTVTIELATQGRGRTLVTLTQDNNANEEARAHSEENWRHMLDGLKRVVEQA